MDREEYMDPLGLPEWSRSHLKRFFALSQRLKHPLSEDPKSRMLEAAEVGRNGDEVLREIRDDLFAKRLFAEVARRKNAKA